MFTTRPELLGTHGMVASTHWLASAAGMAMLERGGNAVDAAVAAGFVLQVVEPHLNGPGGDCPILLYEAAGRHVYVICGQGTAPHAATIDRFRDLGLDLIPPTGLLPAVVPGAFDAWMIMLRDYGTLSLAEVLEPAVGYARDGFPVLPGMSAAIAAVEPLFRDAWPGSGELYLPHGAAPRPGSLFRNPTLAETYLRLIAESQAKSGKRQQQIEAARLGWYTGFVAEAIDRFCRTEEVLDSTGRRHRGLLTGDDLVEWRASYEAPAVLDYNGVVVCKPGPWSQGPVMLQQLALLKQFDLGAMDPLGAEFVHTVTECAKLAFADREAYYGDPNAVDVPVADLLSDAYNVARAALVDDRASLALRPGALPGRAATILVGAGREAAAGAGEPTLQRPTVTPGDTCHVDVIDRHGNMVSATPSGGWLQSSPVIPQLGFCLGTRGQMFWLDPSVPGALAPLKRPRSTLSPGLALKEERPFLAFGTPGGDSQDQWPLVMLLRVLHHGMNLQEAIDAPAFHSEHAPSSFWPRQARPGVLSIEERFAAQVLADLERRGHMVERHGPWSLGRVSAVGRIEANGEALLRGAANPRLMQGYAVGR